MKKFLPVLLLLVSMESFAQDFASTANNFISLLDTAQRSKAVYPLDDPERFDWHFVPKSRKGISFNDLTPPQREAALALLKLSLSAQGYEKANKIKANENVLRELESRPSTDTYRDPLNYYVTIFGTPAANNPWFWRLEGHHLALNFSLNQDGIISSTPTFWGSNPGTVPSGPEKGRQILKAETDLAFELLKSLSREQKKLAVFGETAPKEIITGNNRKANLLVPQGLPYSSMNADQKKLFMQLVSVYVQNYEFGFSNRLMSKIRNAGVDQLSFSWAGGQLRGTGYYYRIQGPLLLIEYDNTQNKGNHIHTVVRDLTNDFAEDILKEHYAKEH